MVFTANGRIRFLLRQIKSETAETASPVLELICLEKLEFRLRLDFFQKTEWVFQIHKILTEQIKIFIYDGGK